ncbi:hypothetical protein EJ02DRAFT_467662 [Clathrospora elynae]|uniref:HAT C-terminal dimerisation domain-containing protein n=1 Tax=Clathrospora elynae TaxID=706981 RepID=A0A6A5SKY7_9PLEO|nr:hypothetical protein EJ02DRAFT_467662 [Clathrospora elynae]
MAVDLHLLTNSKNKRLKQSSQLEKYFDDLLHKYTNGSEKDIALIDNLWAWWLQVGRQKYPVVFKMATNLLSIPCDSQNVTIASKAASTDAHGSSLLRYLSSLTTHMEKLQHLATSVTRTGGTDNPDQMKDYNALLGYFECTQGLETLEFDMADIDHRVLSQAMDKWTLQVASSHDKLPLLSHIGFWCDKQTNPMELEHIPELSRPAGMAEHPSVNESTADDSRSKGLTVMKHGEVIESFIGPTRMNDNERVYSCGSWRLQILLSPLSARQVLGFRRWQSFHRKHDGLVETLLAIMIKRISILLPTLRSCLSFDLGAAQKAFSTSPATQICNLPASIEQNVVIDPSEALEWFNVFERSSVQNFSSSFPSSPLQADWMYFVPILHIYSHTYIHTTTYHLQQQYDDKSVHSQLPARCTVRPMLSIP